MADSSSLVIVDGLEKSYPGRRPGLFAAAEPIRAVQGVSFAIGRGETLGLVGESGSGKSTIGRLVLRLEEPDAGRITFDGVDVTALGTAAIRPIRRRMQVVFQDPYAALNPRMRVRDFVAEPIDVFGLAADRSDRQARVAALFRDVGLDPALSARFPHAFSGGQRQRIAIARALAPEPDFIVLDEAIAALDVSIQAQVVNLLKDLQADRGLSYLFITHDLSMARYICDRIAVLFAGRIVEIGPADAIYDDPRHPFTRVLLSAVPVPDPAAERNRQRSLKDADADYASLGARLVEVAPDHLVAIE